MTPDSIDIMNKLRALKPILEAEMGIIRLRVFGSVARGEAGPESDVDLLVDFKTTPSWEYFTMDEKIGAKIGRKIDIAMEDNLHPMIKTRVLREARDV